MSISPSTSQNQTPRQTSIPSFTNRELSTSSAGNVEHVMSQLSHLPSNQFVMQHIGQEVLSVSQHNRERENMSRLTGVAIDNATSAISTIQSIFKTFADQRCSIIDAEGKIINQVALLDLDEEEALLKLENAKHGISFLRETFDHSFVEVKERIEELTEALKNSSTTVNQRVFDQATALIQHRSDTLKQLQCQLALIQEQDKHQMQCAIDIHNQQLKEQSLKAQELRDQIILQMQKEKQEQIRALQIKEEEHRQVMERAEHALNQQKAANEHELALLRIDVRDAREKYEARVEDRRILEEARAREAQAQKNHEYRMEQSRRSSSSSNSGGGGCCLL